MDKFADVIIAQCISVTVGSLKRIYVFMCGAALPRPASRVSSRDAGVLKRVVRSPAQWQSMGLKNDTCLAWAGDCVFMWMEAPASYPLTERRISSAVGKISENLGFVLVFPVVGWAAVADNAGMKVLESQFSPMLATEETWAIVCGWGAGDADCPEQDGEVGMQLKIRFKLGHPHLESVSGSVLRRPCFPGTLAINAPRTSVKSYCCSCVVISWSFVGPYARKYASRSCLNL